jgi:hypothetical protein
MGSQEEQKKKKKKKKKKHTHIPGEQANRSNIIPSTYTRRWKRLSTVWAVRKHAERTNQLELLHQKERECKTSGVRSVEQRTGIPLTGGVTSARNGQSEERNKKKKKERKKKERKKNKQKKEKNKQRTKERKNGENTEHTTQPDTTPTSVAPRTLTVLGEL